MLKKTNSISLITKQQKNKNKKESLENFNKVYKIMVLFRYFFGGVWLLYTSECWVLLK